MSETDPQARMAALEVWKESTDNRLIGIDRKLDAFMAEMREAMERRARETKQPIWQIVGIALASMFAVVTLLLTVGGMWAASSGKTADRLESGQAAISEVLARHTDQPGHDVAMMLHEETKTRLDQDITPTIARIDERLDEIERTRFRGQEGKILEEQVQKLRERMAIVETLTRSAP